MEQANRWLKPLFFLLVGAILIAGPIHAQKYLIDYPMYERAANRLIDGDVANLHELERKHPPKYHYSYFFAWLFTVFAWMGPALGHWVLPALYGLFFLKLLNFSIRNAGPPALYYGLGVAVVLSSIISVNDAFMTTNIGIGLAFLGVVAFEIHKKYPVIAGLLVGAAITIKLYPLVLLGFFVWQRNQKVVAWSLIGVLLFYLGVPALFEGPQMAWHLIETQVQGLSTFGKHWPMDTLIFQNIPSTAMRYAKSFGLGTENVSTVSLTITSLVVIVFYWPSFWRGNPTPGLEYRLFVLAMALIPLMVPTSWFNMGVFYLPLVGHSVGLAWTKKDRVTGVGFATYFVLYCLTTSDLIGKPLNDRLEFWGIPFFGISTMVLCYAVSTLRAYPNDFWRGERAVGDLREAY